MELLAPAGDAASARAAFANGADAVYLGLPRFSARKEAANFGEEELKNIITYTHLLHKKVYVCLNTLVKEEELPAFLKSVETAWNAGADAFLLQDMWLGKRLKETFPALTLHLSTQGGCCNVKGAELAQRCGFSRVVLARETPFSEIKKISSVLETEVFVQGALCTAFSGQCYLSSFAGNNSGNRGLCKQPCRKKYKIDRTGYENDAYALSLSDLCVGERIAELAAAGVVSLKIEGRMRRSEYVGSAAAYYRALLDGTDPHEKFTDLKRAYNRGDYTEGLAFGQKSGFVSRNVQGHIGEKVGVLDRNGFCKSDYPAREGDGFKLLRKGVEIGGARLRSAGKGGFFLSANVRLNAGDEVRLTTDSSLSVRLSQEKKREIVLSLRFIAGERATVRCGDFCYTGCVLEKARSAPLTAEELKTCFCKTDALPFCVRFAEVQTEGVFLARSALNALRRSFYEELCAFLLPARAVCPPLGERLSADEKERYVSQKTALIATDLGGLKADILILKPRDYAEISARDTQKGEGAKFLFLPPFLTEEDEKAILPALSLFDGIYCDGLYGLPLAKEHGLLFFAGTGWNLSNRIAISETKKAGADYFALSKELSRAEQDELSAEGAFALTLGEIKVMDLCYCPFEKTCGACDRRERYTLTDEEGRKFPLRRYTQAGGCRFEVYNCAPLKGEKGSAGALADLTLSGKDYAPFALCPEQAPYPAATRGHTYRSLL